MYLTVSVTCQYRQFDVNEKKMLSKLENERKLIELLRQFFSKIL